MTVLSFVEAGINPLNHETHGTHELKPSEVGIVVADYLRQTVKQKRVNNEWFYDVSWSWSDSLPTRGRAALKGKPQPLTLILTHNPTHISLVKSASLAQQARYKINQIRSELWLELFHELQQRLLSSKRQAA